MERLELELTDDERAVLDRVVASAAGEFALIRYWFEGLVLTDQRPALPVLASLATKLTQYPKIPIDGHSELGDLRRELAAVKERSDRVRDELAAAKADPLKFLAGRGYTDALVTVCRRCGAIARNARREDVDVNLRTTAIQFTLSAATGQLHAPNTATSNERAMTRPVRFRVLVPADVASGQAVLTFFEAKNELDEIGWTPITNQAPIVGGLALNQRVVIAIALQALAAHLTGVASFQTLVMSNGSLIVDLGTV